MDIQGLSSKNGVETVRPNQVPRIPETIVHLTHKCFTGAHNGFPTKFIHVPICGSGHGFPHDTNALKTKHPIFWVAPSVSPIQTTKEEKK